MTATRANIDSAQIHALLAEKGYDVSDSGPNVMTIREVHSGIAIRSVLQGDIAYFSLTCTTVRTDAVTPEIMHKMLSADSGISTSYFQLYDTGDGHTAITLNNFCKLFDLGPEDEDDLLACVHFLLVDVLHARDLIGELVA